MEGTSAGHASKPMKPQQTDTARGPSPWRARAPVLAIAAVALALRAWGVWFGLPYLYNPDEHLTVNTALSFGSGDLNPHQFQYGSLPSYVLFAAYSFLYLGGHLLGAFHSPKAFAVAFVNDPSAWYLIARCLSVAYGVGTVLVVYRIGNVLAGRTAGITAATLLAVSPLHIALSHVALPDSPMRLLAAASLYFMLLGSRDGLLRDLLLAAAFAGLAAASKFTGVILLVPLLLVLIIRPRRSAPRLPAAAVAALCLGAMVAAYLLGSPYSLLDYRTFARDIFVFQRLFNVAAGWTALLIAQHLVRDLLLVSLGVVGAAAAAVGMVLPAARRGRPHLWSLGHYRRVPKTPPDGVLQQPFAEHGRSPDGKAPLVLGVFAAAYLVVLLVQGRYQSNWFLPLMIPLCAFAGQGFAWLSRQHRAAAPALLTLALAQPFAVSVIADRELTKPDTRTLAKEWMDRNLPPGAVVVLDGGEGGGFPQLRESRRSLEARKQAALRERGGRYTHLATYYDLRIQALRLYRGRVFDTMRLKHDWWQPEEGVSVKGAPAAPGFDRARYDLDYYTRRGARYWATSSLVLHRYHSAQSRRHFPTAYRLYQRIATQAKLIAHFKPGKRAAGPQVFVYRLPPAPPQ